MHFFFFFFLCKFIEITLQITTQLHKLHTPLNTLQKRKRYPGEQ